MNSQQKREQKTQNNQYTKDTTNKAPGSDVRTENPNRRQQKEAGDERLHRHDVFSTDSPRSESYIEEAGTRPANDIGADDMLRSGKGKDSSAA